MWAKYDLPIMNSVCSYEFGLQVTGCRKRYFLIFVFFTFSNFKWILSKILWKNYLFFIIDFKGSLKFYYVKNIFWSTYFDYKTTALLKFLKFPHFFSLLFLCYFSLLFLIITTSLLMIHLKCTVVHYDNLNSSSLNKPYVRFVECAKSFFSISYFYIYFKKGFVKNFMKKLSFLNTNFQNSFQNVVYYRILWCQQTLWY